MLSGFLAFLLLAAQPADDAPVRTGLPEAPAEAKPAAAEPAAPAAPAAAPALDFDPKTKVDGETLQVVLGQRAHFRLDDKGWPVLDKVEEGQLAAAHPEGKVTEAFEPPAEGLLAAALDGSAEKRATLLKLWNGTDKPVDYRAVVLVLVKDKLQPRPVQVCAVPPGGVRTESWPAPIVAVGLARFKPAAAGSVCK